MTSFRALLEIQYRLPIQDIEPRESRLLWNNRRFWAGHSKWLLQLMKVVDWRQADAAREALALLKAPQLCPCKVRIHHAQRLLAFQHAHVHHQSLATESRRTKKK